MEIQWSRGTHQNDDNRQDNPLRIRDWSADTAVLAFGTLEGQQSAKLASRHLFLEFRENQKLGAKIFFVFLGESKIPGSLEVVRARLLPWRVLEGSRAAKSVPNSADEQPAGGCRGSIKKEKLNRDFGFYACLCGRRLRHRNDNFPSGIQCPSSVRGR